MRRRDCVRNLDTPLVWTRSASRRALVQRNAGTRLGITRGIHVG